MIRILIFATILSACSAPRKLETGRDFEQAYRWQGAILPASLSLFAGACYGIHETVVHHPDRIPEGWNRQWWDGRQSWRNKYKDGDPAKGPAWFGSTTAFAWATDAKHLFGTAHRATLFGAGVAIGIGRKRPALHYLYDAGISFAAYTIGFHSMYTLFFDK